MVRVMYTPREQHHLSRAEATDCRNALYADMLRLSSEHVSFQELYSRMYKLRTNGFHSHIRTVCKYCARYLVTLQSLDYIRINECVRTILACAGASARFDEYLAFEFARRYAQAMDIFNKYRFNSLFVEWAYHPDGPAVRRAKRLRWSTGV